MSKHHVDFNRSLYDRYVNARAMPEEMTQQWMDAATFHVPPPVSSVLDLGAGTGRFSWALAETYGAEVLGVEPATNMRRNAEESTQGTRLKFVPGDATSIPAGDGSFDMVWMSMVLHHVHDMESVASEIQRVLKPNGTLLLRNNFRGRLRGVPYYDYFPRALAIDEERMPDLLETVRVFSRASLQCDMVQTVLQYADRSFAEYTARIQMRGLSTLHLVTDEEFERGIKQMKLAVEATASDEPVYEAIDLLVLRTTQ